MLIKILVGVAGSLAALIGLGWLGLQIPPPPWQLSTTDSQKGGSVALPPDLPAPMQRYLQTVAGTQLPRITSAVLTGRARANFGVWMPVRFRLYHRTGYDFRREMEITWFGFPIMQALDQYVNGQGMTGPVGKADTGSRVDQGSNMILWAEAAFFPALYVTDPRIRWEGIDDHSARLYFPFGDAEDELLFHFDPQSGLISHQTARRYRGMSGDKLPWRTDFLRWQTVNGLTIPARISVTWEDQGQPWSYWDFEQVAWNVEMPALATDPLPSR
jgi:hypothetical protein